jgi:hypothetical protein
MDSMMKLPKNYSNQHNVEFVVGSDQYHCHEQNNIHYHSFVGDTVNLFEIVVVVENSKIDYHQCKIEMDQHSTLENYQHGMKIQKDFPVFHHFVI